VELAKEVTRKNDNQTAITKFRAILNSSTSYFNAEPIPKNESDEVAHKKCSDVKGAKKYCPKRWAAIQLWFDESRKAGFSVRRMCVFTICNSSHIFKAEMNSNDTSCFAPWCSCEKFCTQIESGSKDGAVREFSPPTIVARVRQFAARCHV